MRISHCVKIFRFGEKNSIDESSEKNFYELNFDGPVPQTDTGRQVEKTKANG